MSHAGVFHQIVPICVGARRKPVSLHQGVPVLPDIGQIATGLPVIGMRNDEKRCGIS